MLALSPPQLSTFGWPLEDPISRHRQNLMNYNNPDVQTSESFLHFPPLDELDRFPPSTTVSSGGDDPGVVIKKLNHNASERDRRKKINTLYSSLRSLLPPAEQSKKLSIPCTVSRVLKYIPELEQQVEKLVQKKQELLAAVSKQDIHQEKQGKCETRSSFFIVSVSRLSEREVVIQISTFKLHERPLSEILINLEEDGLLVLNASSFESFGERVFYNLHLQVERNCTLDCEVLREKLLALYDKRESRFHGIWALS